MTRIAFRFDDPSETSDHALEREIIARFRETETPLTAAIVPFSCGTGEPRALTAAAVPHLVAAQAEGVLEIALHGFCHRCLARMSDGNSTEFAGIDGQRQREALVRGKSTLEGVFAIRVTGFVPPWNSYDRTTLTLLDELGFSHLSADWGLVTDTPLPFPVIPHTCALTQVREAIDEARQYTGTDPMILAILHHFDFIESGNKEAAMDLAALRELLAWTARQTDVQRTWLGGLAAEIDPENCARNLRLARGRRTLHWRLQSLFPRYTLIADGLPRFTASVARNALQRLPKALAGSG